MTPSEQTKYEKLIELLEDQQLTLKRMQRTCEELEREFRLALNAKPEGRPAGRLE